MTGDFDWDKVEVINSASADPAAGAEPNGFTATTLRTRLYGMRFTLVTDGNAANRTISVTIARNGTNADIYATSATAQTASTTKYYSFIFGMELNSEIVVGDYYYIGLGEGLPYMDLPIGTAIAFTIANKQAGDNASATDRFVQLGPT